jgi:hypothetical protein
MRGWTPFQVTPASRAESCRNCPFLGDGLGETSWPDGPHARGSTTPTCRPGGGRKPSPKAGTGPHNWENSCTVGRLSDPRHRPPWPATIEEFVVTVDHQCFAEPTDERAALAGAPPRGERPSLVREGRTETTGWPSP